MGNPGLQPTCVEPRDVDEVAAATDVAVGRLQPFLREDTLAELWISDWWCEFAVRDKK